jgi:hypothetical protein
MDQRATRFEEGEVEFAVAWKRALNDTECKWPLAYAKTEEGTEVVVTFNPLTICSLTTEVRSKPRKGRKHA